MLQKGCYSAKVYTLKIYPLYSILPMNEATLNSFTCSESSNHENKIHELTKLILLNYEIMRYIRYSLSTHTHSNGSTLDPN